MGLLLKSVSYLIDSQDKDLFESEEDLFTYSDEWESATINYFKNKIFQSELEITTNSKTKLLTLIFNPRRKKTHIILREQTEHFIKKYFPTSDIILRQPKFFAFLIPFPEIDFYLENSKITDESKYNLSISKFRRRTHQNIESYCVRLKSPMNFDFRENEFDPIFQFEFQNIIDISENYKAYLSEFLNISPSQINTQNLISPFYLLTTDEVKSIIEIESSILNDMHEAMLEESQRQEAEYQSRAWDSQMDELYWDAFENNPDNLWNVD